MHGSFLNCFHTKVNPPKDEKGGKTTGKKAKSKSKGKASFRRHGKKSKSKLSKATAAVAETPSVEPPPPLAAPPAEGHLRPGDLLADERMLEPAGDSGAEAHSIRGNKTNRRF